MDILVCSIEIEGLICMLDTGASQLIIDLKIKLKNDSTISEITETGLKFENGSELPADAIIFATGCITCRS